MIKNIVEREIEIEKRLSSIEELIKCCPEISRKKNKIKFFENFIKTWFWGLVNFLFLFIFIYIVIFMLAKPT